MRDTDGDLRMDTKTRVTDQFGRPRRRRREQRQRLRLGPRQPPPHRRTVAAAFPVEGRGTAARPFADTRPVGCVARRCGTDVPEHERVGAARGSGRRRVLRPPSAVAAHARQLRAAGDARQRPQHDMARAAHARHQPRLSGRHPSRRRYPGAIYVGLCALGLSRRSPASRAYGNVFVADPAANLVSRITSARRRRDAPRFQGVRRRGVPRLHRRALPACSLANAPDGTLYLVDLYRGSIEHRLSLTMYLKSYIEARGLLNPRGLGRIWRIVHESTRRAIPARAHRQRSRIWWRSCLIRMAGAATRRSACSSSGATHRRPCAGSTGSRRHRRGTRLHALWTLDGLDAITVAHVEHGARRIASPHVRAAAVRIAERWLDAPTAALRAAVEARARDADPQRATPGRGLSRGVARPTTASGSAWRACSRRRGDDPMLVDVLLTGTRGAESMVLERLLERAAW